MDEAVEEPDAEEEFRRIYWGYATRVRSFFLRRGLSEEEAADLTQEVFLRVHRAWAVSGGRERSAPGSSR